MELKKVKEEDTSKIWVSIAEKQKILATHWNRMSKVLIAGDRIAQERVKNLIQATQEEITFLIQHTK